MRPSTELCRAQEARQHALAAGTTLDNVRNVANMAAAAWAKEAIAAEKREARLLNREAGAELHLDGPESGQPVGSENYASADAE